MKFKTRGGASPQGKQKIYFTGHSDDCAVFFNDISDQILKLCDCAVFYDDDPEHPEDAENFTADLDGMRLIVLVVSGKYIYGDTFAHNTVFKRAVERHIPVLPILVDAELALEFNKKCGDLQCLTPYSNDATEISYEEKLKKFLESVLVGDELAEQVRAAFDAYIFLSYRKKDRRFAQELMRLIHKNEFCRDIAIWYDEFLTPGENFNDAIRAAMEKSELFALAVTPNLLEYPNYVMTEEYPAARKLGKKILPAELLSTDKDELNMRYENIPELIDPTNGAVMSAELGKMLENIAKRENDNDPKHNFFIGLAYLGGIDVEVDFERAVSLIEGAADTELPEALEKLVSMYRTGDGVKLDHKKAIEYQRRLVGVTEKALKAERTKDNAVKLLNALWQLEDFLRETGHVQEAAEITRQMLEYSTEFVGEWDEPMMKFYLSSCYLKLGDCFRMMLKPSEARKYYEEGVKLRRQLVEQTDSRASVRDLAIGYFSLGNICVMEKNYSSAREYFDKSREIFKRLSDTDDTGDTELRFNLYASIEKMGDTYLSEGNYSAAWDCYEQCRKIIEELADGSNSPDILRAQSVLFSRFGDLYYVQNDLAKAREYGEKGLKIDEQLSERFDLAVSKTDIIGECNGLAELCVNTNDLVSAKSYYKKCLDTTRLLLEQNDSEVVQGGIYSFCLNIVDMCIRLEELTEAKKYSETALAEAKRYAARPGLSNKDDAAKGIAKCYGSLGNIYAMEGDLSKARKYYGVCLEIFEPLAERNGSMEIYIEMFLQYSAIGKWCVQFGDKAASKKYFIKGLKAAERIADSEEPLSYEFLADANYFMYSVSLMKRNKRRYLQESRKHCLYLIEHFPDNRNYADFLKQLDELSEL